MYLFIAQPLDVVVTRADAVHCKNIARSAVAEKIRHCVLGTSTKQLMTAANGSPARQPHNALPVPGIPSKLVSCDTKCSEHARFSCVAQLVPVEVETFDLQVMVRRLFSFALAPRLSHRPGQSSSTGFHTLPRPPSSLHEASLPTNVFFPSSVASFSHPPPPPRPFPVSLSLLLPDVS